MYMLLLGIITLVMTIPLASQHLSTILIHRIALLITLFSALLSYNTLKVIPLSSGIGLLGGLFQSTILFQIPISWVLGYFFLDGSELLLSFVPSTQEAVLAAALIVYSNAETDKSLILADNKGKTGIYMWTHKESGKFYIGSATDMSSRFRFLLLVLFSQIPL